MRYKISFEFPLLNQKNVQHAHSHFAFGGWVTQTLFFLLVNYLNKNKTGINFFKRYNKLLLLNLICAYGMLISFVIYGYNFISIIFSTSSIFVSFFVVTSRGLNFETLSNCSCSFLISLCCSSVSGLNIAFSKLRTLSSFVCLIPPPTSYSSPHPPL